MLYPFFIRLLPSFPCAAAFLAVSDITDGTLIIFIFLSKKPVVTGSVKTLSGQASYWVAGMFYYFMSPVSPHIKIGLWIAAIMLLSLALFYFTRHPKPLPFFAPPHKDKDAEKPSTAIKGLVTAYGSNGDGDIDKIVLQTTGALVWLHFPPHTARQVMHIAQKNILVTASVRETAKPHHDDIRQQELVSIRSAVSGETLEVAGILPPAPGPGNETTIKGSVIDYQKDDKGHINAFILSGKLVSLPPHARETVLPLLTDARNIVVKGYQRNPNDGFVNSSGLDVIRPYAIIIDSVSYLVQ